MSGYDAEAPTEKVRPKFRDRPYEREAFPLSDGVISLGRGKKAAGVSDDTVVALLTLSEDSADAITTRVSSYFSRRRRVKV